MRPPCEDRSQLNLFATAAARAHSGRQLLPLPLVPIEEGSSSAAVVAEAAAWLLQLRPGSDAPEEAPGSRVIVPRRPSGSDGAVPRLAAAQRRSPAAASSGVAAAKQLPRWPRTQRFGGSAATLPPANAAPAHVPCASPQPLRCQAAAARCPLPADCSAVAPPHRFCSSYPPLTRSRERPEETPPPQRGRRHLKAPQADPLVRARRRSHAVLAIPTARFDTCGAQNVAGESAYERAAPQADSGAEPGRGSVAPSSPRRPASGGSPPPPSAAVAATAASLRAAEAWGN